MEKRNLVLFALALFSCSKSEVSPVGGELEVSILNVSTAKVCIYRNDSISKGCDDFDLNYESSLHYSRLEQGNYRIEAKAGKRKREAKVYYSGKSQSVSIEF